MVLKQLPTNRIAEVRNLRGMTQQQLADKVGSHWITVSKLERGKIRLTDEWLFKLAEALDVDEFDLKPAEKALTTIDVSGELFPGGNISYYDEDDPHSTTIYNSIFHLATTIWLYVNTDSLAPMFHDGDLMGFREAHGFKPEVFSGRLCLCWLHPSKQSVVGFVSGHGPASYTIALAGGGIMKDCHISSIAPLTVVFSNLETLFGDYYDNAAPESQGNEE